jgi:hypothetical protein
MAGGNRNLDWMLDVAKEVFAELNVREAKVAVIHAELDADTVIGASQGRTASDRSRAGVRESTIVGQMGIHPLITALDAGAQYVLAGRSCDIALFASDMIRRGIEPGLAYHVGDGWSAARSPATPARPETAWSRRSTTTTRRCSSPPTQVGAARRIRLPRIRSTRRVTRNCSSIPRASS